MKTKIIITIVIFCIIAVTIGVTLYISRKITSDKFIINLVENNTDIRFSFDNNIYNNNIINVKNRNMFKKIALKGEIGLAESYIDGDWDAYDLENIIYKLKLKYELLANQIKKQSLTFIIMEIKTNIENRNNSIRSSKKNISHHYNIGNDLYKKMLGKHMQYTCAYFYKPELNLDEAQFAKMKMIAKKLDLSPGLLVLDIGCGYGSMGCFLAKYYGVKVIGCTLSKEQKIFGDKNFSHSNMKIILRDYRHLNGKFDRIYSVGMFEHVGRKNYKEYFNKCHALLKDNGLMLLHTIGTKSRTWSQNCFINKYIFPEGELPHIKNLTGKFMDNWNMEDWQNMGQSYAKTLRSWRNNIGNWQGLDKYDYKFRRMWDYYLLGCAANFQSRGIFLWQIVFTKNPNNRKDDCHHLRNYFL